MKWFRSHKPHSIPNLTGPDMDRIMSALAKDNNSLAFCDLEGGYSFVEVTAFQKYYFDDAGRLHWVARYTLTFPGWLWEKLKDRVSDSELRAYLLRPDAKEENNV